MSQKWITKKGKDGENRHIPIDEGSRVREKEITPKNTHEKDAFDLLDKGTYYVVLGMTMLSDKLHTTPEGMEDMENVSRCIEKIDHIAEKWERLYGHH